MAIYKGNIRISTVGGGGVDVRRTTNDRSNPNGWAMNTEIDFGDGTFGYRWSGNIVVAANTSINTVAPLPIPISEIIDAGGWWQNGANANTRQVGGVIISTGTGPANVTSSSGISWSLASGAFVINTYSSAARVGTTFNAYDVWVRYRKV